MEPISNLVTKVNVLIAEELTNIDLLPLLEIDKAEYREELEKCSMSAHNFFLLQQEKDLSSIYEYVQHLKSSIEEKARAVSEKITIK